MAVHCELIEVAHSEDVVGSLVARMLQKSVVIAILGALEDAISRMAPGYAALKTGRSTAV